MNRRTLLFGIGILVLIGLASWALWAFVFADRGSTQNEVPNVAVAENGSRTISYDTDGVSVVVPEDWDGSVFEDPGAGLVVHNVGNNFTLDARLYIERDSLVTPDTFKQDNPEYNIEELSDSRYVQINYTGRVLKEEEEESLENSEELTDKSTGKQWVENSYVVGSVVWRENIVIHVQCAVEGASYTSQVNVCDNFVSSLKGS